MSKRILIEACISSVEDAIAAYEGGADRLELNTALSLDGLTPSIGLLRRVKEAVPLPVIVMIRPRPYGFMYSPSEFAVMQSDIDTFLREEPAGFAFGILKDNFQIDLDRSKIITKQIKGTEIVFHRAFDVTPDPESALESLIELGVKRVLTSGQNQTAFDGWETLYKLQQLAEERITILPGSGIKPTNVASLISKTGCTQVHGTFRPSSANHSYTGLDILRASPPTGTSKAIVAEVRSIVDALQL